jgi:hypothetical protein
MALFTPIVNGKRLEMKLSDEDEMKIYRGPGYKGVVTDQKTGKQYRISGKKCGLPHCWCDSEAKEI